MTGTGTNFTLNEIPTGIFTDHPIVALLALAALAAGLVALLFLRRRRAPRYPYRLHNPLMLAMRPDLVVDEQAVQVNAGTPYRVLSVGKWTVIVEARLPDGTTVVGYTSKGHVHT